MVTSFFALLSRHVGAHPYLPPPLSLPTPRRTASTPIPLHRFPHPLPASQPHSHHPNSFTTLHWWNSIPTLACFFPSLPLTPPYSLNFCSSLTFMVPRPPPLISYSSFKVTPVFARLPPSTHYALSPLHRQTTNPSSFAVVNDPETISFSQPIGLPRSAETQQVTQPALRSFWPG